jgi:hypothetical protein
MRMTSCESVIVNAPPSTIQTPFHALPFLAKRLLPSVLKFRRYSLPCGCTEVFYLQRITSPFTPIVAEAAVEFPRFLKSLKLQASFLSLVTSIS